MRRTSTLTLVIAIALNGWLLAPPGFAQRAGLPRAPRASPEFSSYRETEPDLLSPYAPHTTSATDEGRPSYSRTRPARPPRSPEYRRATPAPRTVGDYFPGLRSGQGPNRNVVGSTTLCHPGRRALLMHR